MKYPTKAFFSEFDHVYATLGDKGRPQLMLWYIRKYYTQTIL